MAFILFYKYFITIRNRCIIESAFSQIRVMTWVQVVSHEKNGHWLNDLSLVYQLEATWTHGQRYSIQQKKRAHNSVPKCPCNLLQSADQPMAGSSSLEGHFGTGLCTRFSSAWSNVECGSIIQFHHSQHLLLLSKQVNVQGRQSELKIGSCTRCSPKPSHNFQGRAGSLVLV